jgi:protoheme IX farnesyltransferase
MTPGEMHTPMTRASTSHPSLFDDFLSLAKPRLSGMVVITAACGLLLARSTEQGVQEALAHGVSSTLLRDLMSLIGTSLIVAAANTINCVLEKDTDAFMERTRNRPLVQGRIAPLTALLVGVGLAVLATALLWSAANPLTAALGLVGFFSYVAVYTPLKRHSMTALFAGAIPGAIPPMMGWTTVTNHMGLGAWVLFGILFFWQLPHFIAISIFRQSEYDSAGLKTVPGTMGVDAAGRHMLIYSALLVGVSLLPCAFDLAGQGYFLAASSIGLLFTGLSLAGILKIGDLNWSRLVFFGSLAYLPLVLGTWVVEQWLNGRG